MASNATPGTVPTLHNYTTYYNTDILGILCNICNNVNTSYMGGTLFSFLKLMFVICMLLSFYIDIEFSPVKTITSYSGL